MISIFKNYKNHLVNFVGSKGCQRSGEKRCMAKRDKLAMQLQVVNMGLIKSNMLLWHCMYVS